MRLGPVARAAFALVGFPCMIAQPALSGPPLASAAGSREAPRQSLSLAEVVYQAERYSPRLKAALDAEKSAAQTLRISRSLYYPTLEATAVDSIGYPASASAPEGFNGLMGSPFREGISGGFYGTFLFFDLGREYGVKASRYGLDAVREQRDVERLNVDLKAANLYLDAIRASAERDAWEAIQKEIERLYGVVRKFVRSGQYSEVTQWLLKDKLENALRSKEDLDFAYQAALQRIEIFIGAEAGTLRLEGFQSLDPALAALNQHRRPQSPLVATPLLEARVSETLISVRSAQNWPRLLGIASAGGMDNSRLVPVQNYSAWLGLTIPIFEGFRITGEVDRARAEAERAAQLADQARLDLADSDTRYEQEIRSRESEIRHDRIARDYALNALKLAEHRYTTFVGPLSDVRDSLSSYEEAEIRLTGDQVELYRSKLAQGLVDGGTLQD